MGELRKNTTSTGTITKKNGIFGKFETVGTKNKLYCAIEIKTDIVPLKNYEVFFFFIP